MLFIIEHFNWFIKMETEEGTDCCTTADRQLIGGAPLRTT